MLSKYGATYPWEIGSDHFTMAWHPSILPRVLFVLAWEHVETNSRMLNRYLSVTRIATPKTRHVGREGTRRLIMEAGARRAAVHLLDFYQLILQLIPNLQYGRPVSLTHPDAVLPNPQPPTPPVPYAEYLQQWDGVRRAEGGWEGAG